MVVNFSKIGLIVFFLICTSIKAQTVFETDKIADSENRIFHNVSQNLLKYTPETENYDLKYHRLKWEIDPDTNYINGEITSYFVPTVNDFNEVFFDLNTSMTVDSVVYQNNTVAFLQQINNTLKIILPDTIPIGMLDSITVFYQGTPTNSGFGAFVKSTHTNQSIIWTLSEPFGAMEWWPCKQTLNDKIDSIDIIVKTPLINKVATQGVLYNVTDDGTYKTYYWKHRYPITTYLISLAVTNYAEFTIQANLTNGSLPILNYVYPEDSLNSFNSINLILPIIELFDSIYTPYPFQNEKYGHAQFGWGGGMEHQTMSSMGNFGQQLMAHELAHQWFGDKITCSSWSDIWLNEGFATYSTGLFFKYIATSWWQAWKEDIRNSVTSAPNGSVYNPDTTNVNRIFSSRLSYKKGAAVLRMLEWKLGDTIFFPAVRNYLSDSNLAYDYSSTQTLIQHFETVCGYSLTEYFNDWFYGEGYPSYHITWNQAGNNLNFWVSQSQSHNSVSFYEMPIPIYLSGQGQDTILVFDHTFSGQHFTASIPFVADSISFDPELWIVSNNNTIVVGLEESVQNDEIVLFPNPVFNTLTINSQKLIESVVFYNIVGEMVMTTKEQHKIDVSQLPKGVYTIEIVLNNEKIRKKISKI